MNGPVLIFDFDGTIADTHHYIVGISNRLAREFKYDEIDWNMVDSLRDKTAKEIIQYLKVPLLKIPAILSRGKKEFNKGITEVKPIDGLSDVLRSLRSRGVVMGILSSNTAENIRKFLQNHALEVFAFIHSTSKVWSKNISLERLISGRNLDRNSIHYIGDEARDITAARRSGVKSVAVSWGYNSARILRSHNPDFMVNLPGELLRFCEHIAT
ncbi:MAG: HAD hydrolase-like protein [Lentisphaerae bacterium]|nr:HAD hydrolase-like protein [Lentisphaerota bacterium]